MVVISIKVFLLFAVSGVPNLFNSFPRSPYIFQLLCYLIVTCQMVSVVLYVSLIRYNPADVLV
jgi:hypothetical protein